MANFVFNIAKGKVGGFYDRVNDNDPSTSRLIVIPVEASGLQTQAVLEDMDTIDAVFAGATNEQTTLGRKYLTDAELAASAPDDTNNRFDLDIPDIIWTAGTGNAVAGLIIAYDPASGADSTLIPLTYHDFAVTPDGSDIVAVIAATGFFRAS
jgi:hypothetical protein